MVSWQFLVFGTVGAVGAAMALATVAALATYRRTGSFPGQAADAPPPSPRDIRLLYLRIVVGLLFALSGLYALQDLELL